MLQASVLGAPALRLPPDAVMSFSRQLAQQVTRAHQLMGFDQIETNQLLANQLSVEALGKVYDAMQRSGVIPKRK